MSHPGVHCAGCTAGAAIPVVPLAAFCGLTWVVEHLIEVVVIAGACAVLSVAAMVWLMRWADRRDTRPVALWKACGIPAPAVTATVIPQVTRGAPQAITNYHGPVVYVGTSPDAEAAAARVIRSALPGQGKQSITEE